MLYRSASDPLSESMAAVAHRDALRQRCAVLESEARSLRRQRADALTALRSIVRSVGAEPPAGSRGALGVERAQDRFEKLDAAVRAVGQSWAKARNRLEQQGEVDQALREALDLKLQQIASLDPALSDHLNALLAELARGLEAREQRVKALRHGDAAIGALIRANGQLRAALGPALLGEGPSRKHRRRCSDLLTEATTKIAILQRQLQRLGDAPVSGLRLLPLPEPSGRWTSTWLGRAATRRQLSASREAVATVRANLSTSLSELRSRARLHDDRLTTLWNELCRTAAAH